MTQEPQRPQSDDICTACGRDLVWEGECSLCRDGRLERWKESGYINTRIYDDE